MESLAKKHSRRAVREALTSLPNSLDEMYDEVLERIYSQDADDVQLAKKLLSWVSYSLKPLTVTELQHALAVEPDEAERGSTGRAHPPQPILVRVHLVVQDVEELVQSFPLQQELGGVVRELSTQAPD